MLVAIEDFVPERPWLSLQPGGGREFRPRHGTVVEAFNAFLAEDPDAAWIRSFAGDLTVRQVADRAQRLGSAIVAKGVTSGDRVGVWLQNSPQFIVSALGAWLAGAVLVPINPMYRQDEFAHILHDARLSALIADPTYLARLDPETLSEVHALPLLATTSSAENTGAQGHGMATLSLEKLLDVTDAVALTSVKPEDVAVIIYTSGTTGPAKGSVGTHWAIAYCSEFYEHWVPLSASDRSLTIAPLFHITGLVGNLTSAVFARCAIILLGRFSAELGLEAVRRWRPTFTLAAITALNSLVAAEGSEPADYETMTKIHTGGQPVPPATIQRFERATGQYIYNAYGMTEANGPLAFVPPGRRAPVDPVSGSLSVGIPIYGTDAAVVDENGAVVPAGSVGEIFVRGPGLAEGYWENREETERAWTSGWFRTGDVGVMSEDGWLFVVDRKKDLINASGYKVWPREVEDVLSAHPAVMEAAVVGEPDEYRGETVVAFVSLRSGHAADEADLLTFVAQRLAAYKRPSAVTILASLPKSPSGKILRRHLRTETGGRGAGRRSASPDQTGSA